MKKSLTTIAGLSLGGLFLWLAVRGVNLREMSRNLLQADIRFLIPFIMILAAFYWLKAVRWGLLLNPAKPISAIILIPSLMVGFAGNNVLPVRLGELIRVYLASRDVMKSKSFILATVALERVFDAVSVLLLLSIATTFISTDLTELDAARNVLIVGSAILLIAILALAFTPNWFRNACGRVFSFLPSRIYSMSVNQMDNLREGLAALRARGVILRISLNSIAQWALLGACIVFSFEALDLNLSPAAGYLILALVVAGISLPGAPGFFGTIEYCFVVGLAIFGVDSTTALSVAIFYHGTTFFFVTVSGAYFLRRYGVSWVDLKSRAEPVIASED